MPFLNIKTLNYYFNYILCHPIAIIKALITLAFKGRREFFIKLNKVKERDNLLTEKKSNLITKTKAVTLIIVYFLISILFFSISHLFYLLFFIVRKRIVINTNNKEINGVSFIIPTWNKKEMVLECVKCLDKILSVEALNIPKEIIVIDNGSIDQTTESLNKLKTITPITIIHSKINLGFAKAINLGASKAKYNYIYLMNNDMLPQSKFLSEIISFAEKLLKQNKPFFGLSSHIFFHDPKKRREESGKNYFKPDPGFLYVAHCVNNNNLQSPSITGYPGGGSSLINKNLFLQLGGYDQDSYVPLYGEDLDLGFIAWKLGFPSYFISSSHIMHHHRSSTKKLNIDPNYYMFKNWLTFILKNYNSLNLILSHVLIYPFRMINNKRFRSYAWQNLKIIHIIMYKKIKLYKYRITHKDSELINFPEFEFKFENINE